MQCSKQYSGLQVTVNYKIILVYWIGFKIELWLLSKKQTNKQNPTTTKTKKPKPKHIMIPIYAIYCNLLWVCPTVAISDREWLESRIVWKGNDNFSLSRHFHFPSVGICCLLVFETSTARSGNRLTSAVAAADSGNSNQRIPGSPDKHNETLHRWQSFPLK